MKLLYLVNAKIPTDKAHGAQITKMCEAFAANGGEVNLVVPRRVNRIKDDSFEYYKIKKNFIIKKLPCLDFILWGSESFLAKPIMLLQSVTFYLSSLVYLLFNRYDIFYTRGSFPHLFLKNYVLETHALPKKMNWLNKRLYEKARGIIVLTKSIKDKLVEIGIKSEKVFISPDGVDLEIFDITISQPSARRKLSLPEDKNIIVYTGKFKTMGMDKGINDILKSLTYLPTDIIFVAVGGSKDDLAYYQKQAEELKVENRVMLIGHVSQAELAIYQKAADILLMPFPFSQHYAYYMSPLKMFEYMAGKRPIIASDLPSITEILNGHNSSLCEPDNPKDLSEKIANILANKALGEKLADRAYEEVKFHTWEKRAERIINFVKF